jgi:O-antigen/teichoic acid export membrane protein
MKRLRSSVSGGSLKARAVRSTMLTLVGFGGGNVLRLAGNLVLTRLLFPEAFGLMALVMVTTTALAMFSDIGLRPAIIQNARGDDPAFLNTAWTMGILRGAVLWLASCALAVPMARFYGEPLLAQLLPVAGLAALFSGFGSTRLATVNRTLTLGRITALGLGTQVVGILVTIALTYWTRSVWALAFGSLASPLLMAALSHLVLPGHPNRLALEPQAARQLMKFGKYIFLSTIAGYFINQGDRAIVGKFVTLNDLALYNIAFFLATAPLLLARQLMAQVIFPLYAQRPLTHSAENREKIFRARRLLTGLSLSIAASFALVGNWLVILLYDSRYEGAGPILVLLALSQFPSIITASYDSMALAAGHSGRYAVMVSCNALIRVIMLLFATTHFGVVGAALASLPAALIYYPILMYLIRPYRGWDPRHDMLYFAAAAAAAAVVFWANAETLAPLLTRV